MAAEARLLFPEAPPLAPTPPSPGTCTLGLGRLQGEWGVPAKASWLGLSDPRCQSPASQIWTPPWGACANRLLGRPHGLWSVGSSPAGLSALETQEAPWLPRQ